MIEMRLADIAAVTGGQLRHATGDERITSVEFDSRATGPGALYLTLPGARVDGHDFADAAVAAGASAVLTARELDLPSVVVPAAARATGTYLDDVDPDGSGAAVLAALAKLAVHVLGALPDLTLVGITGSSGKTSTKDLIGAVLAPLGPMVAPPGSFNTELGLPWTALRADRDTRHLVLEYSARNVGHIAALARIARPRISVVINVGSAHIGEFGSIEGIALAKGELVEALPAAGVAVLNGDDANVVAMAGRTAARKVFYGLGPDADVRATDVVLDAGRPRFTLVTPAGSAEVALQLVGEHHVGNALAAAAVGLECGASPEAVAAALSGATAASKWRMEVTERADGVTVINDAYNANPDSMRAALRALAAVGEGRRTWAVLGPMGELGGETVPAHRGIAETARSLGAEVLAVGAPDYPAQRSVPDVESAVVMLEAELAPGDVVLVKGSRAADLQRVAQRLLAEAPAAT
ncbi:UDP-N-acetylmuramoyl-tripeptide--D-alanyl-D-alanine ligase [Pseudonocardia sp. TRM90224]|uniref:UDP-N-acetylmuramoyl-tripeptide--D-alanyl-D- alanine ligase n=1 Tax=Pseudonocardia sp. TRM90224 TaxID=2812678 RepID=UPI001E439750|nr:UDP-N-acetylmuramoyl-tripeptide--D-alanyl-D-alanine ligase [Pseudonocardia sp. TRM90224]